MTTVLLVDDEPTILRILVRELGVEGYALRTATSGPEALARLAAEDVAVLVTDQRMPGMCGTDLIAKVRERSPLTVCLLLVTGSDRETAARALARGSIYRALTKPWDFRELQQAIRFAADAHELHRRNEALHREAGERTGRIAAQVRSAAETIRLALTMAGHDLAAGRDPEIVRATLERAASAVEGLAGAAEAIATADDDAEEPAADPRRPIEDALRVLAPLAELRGVSLVVDLDQTPAVACPAPLLERVVLSVLAATVARTQRGRDVRVRLTADEGAGQATIDVVDEGPAASLGSAVADAARLAESLGGRLTVVPRPIEGARVLLEFPLRDTTEPHADVEPFLLTDIVAP